MMTRRPRPSPFTPAPSVSIVPATSQPLTWGSPSGGGKRPSSRSMSTWLSAHARTRTTPEDDLKFVDATVRPYQLFDAPRVDDHPTNLLHVVEPREDAALEGEQRAAARARPLGDLDHVARAVPEERHRLPVEAREDQLAAPAPTVRPVHGVQDLGIAVVLVHVHEPGARVALEPPRRHLREPREGGRPRAERRLDLRPRRRGRGGRPPRGPPG